jgi:hypothetical protein
MKSKQFSDFEHLFTRDSIGTLTNGDPIILTFDYSTNRHGTVKGWKATSPLKGDPEWRILMRDIHKEDGPPPVMMVEAVMDEVSRNKNPSNHDVVIFGYGGRGGADFTSVVIRDRTTGMLYADVISAVDFFEFEAEVQYDDVTILHAMIGSINEGGEICDGMRETIALARI